jgi:glutathione S-transferase
MRTLYGLGQSPFTEKARWALDHHSIAYRYHEHLPLLGEVPLRLKARNRPRGTKASVPLLVDGPDVLPTSLAIAQYADRIGRGAALFPKDQLDDVLRWAEHSDRILDIGRSAVMVGLRTNRQAQREALPPFIPGPLRGVMTPMIVTAALFLTSKHDVPRDSAAELEKLRPLLDDVRRTLGGGSYLLSGLTFADLAVAASLQVLRPRKDAPLGPGTRAIWAHESIAEEYEDLLAWRDKLYREHRRD